MDFLFGEKEEQFRTEIRAFVKENIPYGTIGNLFDEEQSDEAWEFAMSTAKKLAHKKWLVLSWPVEFGGMGAPAWERVVLSEEASYWGIPGLSMGISGTAWVGPTLMLVGTQKQQEKFLPPIAAGEPDGVWCTGYSEPDSGSDLASLQTRAVRDGDAYVINGQKVWTSCAHRARWMWLICRTDPNAEKKHQGLSIFMVDMRSAGLSVSPLKNLVGGHVFNEVFLKDVRVPAENLVGQENKGWNLLMTALGFERGTAVPFTAAIRRKFDALVQYVKETGLMKRPQVRIKLADLAVDIETARLLAYEPVCLADKGIVNVYAASRDKANVDLLHEKLARVGTEILGAYSQMDYLHKDSRWTRLDGTFEHLYYYNAGMAIAAGTTYVQKNIVGQFGLHLPRSY